MGTKFLLIKRPRRLAVTLILLAGCGQESPFATASPTRTPGRRGPALVQVENSVLARPLSGLQHADIVYEYLGEGGHHAYAAIYFNPSGTERIEPVRSARPITLPRFEHSLGQHDAGSGEHGGISPDLIPPGDRHVLGHRQRLHLCQRNPYVRETGPLTDMDTGPPIKPVNVIVIQVAHHDAGFTDVPGAPAQAFDLQGSGKAAVLQAATTTRRPGT